MFERAGPVVAGDPLMALEQAQAPLRVIVFPGGANLPLWVADERGFFSRNGVSVRVTPTPNSVALVQSLAERTQDIALSAFDNIVAYQEGQGEVALDAPPDFFAFMGYTRGTLRLVVNPEVKGYADLRGKTLAVDAKATGYSLVLQKLLQLGGLGEGDYTLASVGGTATRARQLMENRFAGTMLTTPLELAPEAKGYRRLANAIDVLGPYQTIVGMARRSWATENRERLHGFIRASVAAIDWLFEPQNRAEAVSIYRRNLPDLPPATAEKHVEALIGEHEGFVRGGCLDAEGLRTVLSVRSEFGRPRKRLEEPARYVDESYYRGALAR